MRLTVSISVLLLGLAPVAWAQDTNTVSLADVARQTRAHAGTAVKSWDDQNSDFGRTTDESTACGAPLPEIPSGFVAGLIGQPVNDPNLAKLLTHWLSKHPDLDLMHPDDLAKLQFPRTPVQVESNQAAAHRIAQRWLAQVSAAANSGSPNDFSAAAAALNNSEKSNDGAVLAAAVDAEQQRRVRSDGSEADKVQEAVNLYTICETRRHQEFEGEIDKLAKQELQKSVAELQVGAGQNAAENPQNAQNLQNGQSPQNPQDAQNARNQQNGQKVPTNGL
jgi:hypothetical protein